MSSQGGRLFHEYRQTMESKKRMIMEDIEVNRMMGRFQKETILITKKNDERLIRQLVAPPKEYQNGYIEVNQK